VKHASTAGYSVSVVPPQLGILESELSAYRHQLEAGIDIERQLEMMLLSRYETARNLDNFGLFEALDQLDVLQHLPAEDRQGRQIVSFASLPDRLRKLTATLEAEAADADVSPDPALLIPAAFKLRWISALTRSEIRTLLSELIEVMAQGEAALLREDADSFASTVLFEALDNVRMHSLDTTRHREQPAALLGAAFVRLDKSTPSISPERGHYSLNVVLADVGDGIVSRLGPHFEPSRHDPLLHPDVRGWPRSARTVVWAFHALSTSRPDLSGEPPARGLARASQQIRYHGGAIRVRTDAVEVSIEHELPGHSAHYRNLRKGMIPGTTLEVTIPYGRPRLPLPPIDSGDDIVVVRILSRDRSRAAYKVAQALAANSPATGVVIFLPDWEVSPDGGQTSAELLGALSAITQGYPTAVLFGVPGSAQLFSCFEALAEQSRATEGVHAGSESAVPVPEEPMLLIGTDRRAIWWGGPSTVSQALAPIAVAAGFDLATGPFDTDDAIAAQVLPHHIAERAGWLRRGNDGRPLFNAGAIQGALLVWLRTRITSHIARGGSGVIEEDRLLTTLGTVGRFVDLARILRATGTTELAGQLAADVARAHLQGDVGLVAALPDVPEAYLLAFCHSLSYEGRVVRMDPSVPGWRLAPPPDSGPGGSVILAGFRHKGETLRAVAEQLVRWRIEPALAVIALDGSKPAGIPVVALYEDVPAVALISTEVPPAKTSAAELAARMPWPEVADATYLISPDEFTDKLATHGVGFQLVHIERSAERHLVGYFDLHEALQVDALREEFDDLFLKLLEPIIGRSGEPTILLYPKDDVRTAGAIATRLAARIPRSRLLPAERNFEPAASEPNHLIGAAVFIDWGVVTARTAREALYQLVARGASPVSFIALASQLDGTADRDLRAVAALHGTTRPTSSEPEQDSLFRHSEHATAVSAVDNSITVPVTFRCLTRVTPITYSRGTCPLCHALSDFGTFAREAPVPLLRSAALDKLALLQPRQRDDALRHVRDLYGADLDWAARSAIITLWNRLHGALSSIRSSYELLAVLNDEGRNNREVVAVAICRILAVRHDLLHSPPLIYGQFRQAIAELALSLLLPPDDGSERHFLSSPVKRQAVVALRACSKDHFIDALPNIVRTNVHSRAVLTEALLATHSILERPYFHGTTLMTHLYVQLQACEESLALPERTGQIDEDIVQTVRVLKRRASTRIARAESGTTERAAWSILKLEYGPELRLHHHGINKLNQIARVLDDLVTKNAVDSGDLSGRLNVLRFLNGLWQNCADVLAAAVLPHLPALANIFASNYYRDKVGHPEDWAQWQVLVASQSMEQDLVFPTLLSQLTQKPETFDEYSRLELLRQADWLQRFFLPLKRSAQAGRPNPSRQTLLLQWLEECPTTVSQFRGALRNAMEDVRAASVRFEAGSVEAPKSLDGVLLFCPKGLLGEVAGALADNMEEHCASNKPVRVSMSVQQQSDAITFEVRSHSTASSGLLKRKEGGLSGLNRRLAPFGCSVDWETDRGDFLTVISLQLWDDNYD
jgi:hypothetical protein